MLFSICRGNSESPGERCAWARVLMLLMVYFGNSAKIIHRGNVVRLREQNHLRSRQRLRRKAPKLPSRNRMIKNWAVPNQDDRITEKFDALSRYDFHSIDCRKQVLLFTQTNRGAVRHVTSQLKQKNTHFKSAAEMCI